MNVGKKIRELRKAKKMTILELATAIGSDVGNISRLERGVQGYSENTLKKISGALGIPVSELFSTSEVEESVQKYSSSFNEKSEGENMFKIDVLDVFASAGDGSINSYDIIEVVNSIEYKPEFARLSFRGKPASDIKLINVRGDSMSGTIETGDLIFIDISVKVFDGDGIYVFSFDEKLYVKRLQMLKDKLVVLSDNPKYKEWYIERDDEYRLNISGRVIISQSQELRIHG